MHKASFSVVASRCPNILIPDLFGYFYSRVFVFYIQHPPYL